ncbi:MAG: VCBS repeat-containing protein [Rhodothermales bacterium]|nr:VCBS repeat-containing protein [Rhodothermales bacterium]MBO6780302.1 VCBS repeat-containing protein [Rhodothermales bacterium]
MRPLIALVFLTAIPASAQSFLEVPAPFATPPDGSAIIFGSSLADVNRDGRPDYYHRGRLYLQTDSLVFTDVMGTGRFPAIDGTEVFGGVVGDADGDGFRDLYVEDFDPGSRFFRNRYGLRWDLASAESGIDMSEAQSQGAVWGDYDRDGDVDLFVGEEFGGNKLFENLGGGVFRDAGMSAILNERKSYGVAAADFDRDGDLDIYIAACSQGDPAQSRNSLFRNEGDGTFVDIGAEAMVADSLAGWATVWLDYDRDQWPDLFVANMPIYGPNARTGVNKLYRNLGDGTFEDVSVAAGVAGGDDDWGFGASAGDFDNDGWEDIYLANDFSNHQLFRNRGDGTFEDVWPDLGVDPFTGTLAVATADLNNDGWLDLAFASREGNRVQTGTGDGNWLRMHLRAEGENRDALGALLTTWVNGNAMIREVHAGDGMTSQNHDLSVHVGLGQASVADSVTVRWPAGATTRFLDVGANQVLHLSESSGIADPPPFPELEEGDLGTQAGPEIRFALTATEAGVSYQLVLAHLESTTLAEYELTGSELSVDVTGLPNGDYAWTVIAERDGFVRASRSTGSFTWSGATHTDRLDEPSLWSMWPNPVSEILTIETNARDRLVVFDLLGRAVLQAQVTPGRNRLDVSGLVPGLYVLRLESGRLTRPVVRR